MRSISSVFRAILLGAALALSAMAANATDSNLFSLLELPTGESPTKVHADFHLLDVQRIHDEAETFEFSGVLTLTWQDSRQRFDPEAAGVSEMTYNGGYQFNELAPAWYPQAIIANVAGVQETQGVLLRVSPDGTSKLVQTINAEARSRLNLRRYPFDAQRLEIIFEILGFDSSEVAIESGPATVNQSKIQVPQWELVSVTTSSAAMAAPYAGASGGSSAYVISLELQRKSFFMVRLVVLPMIVIMMLSWAVFWMDRSSLGDRMSVSFVGILTAVAYQTMISDIMPQISYMTLIHGFLYFSFMLMCASVIVNLIVGSADRKGDFALGDRIDRHCRWMFPVAYTALVSLVTVLAFTWT